MNEKELIKACEDGDLEKVKSIIEKGADINLEYDDWTPLTKASEKGHLNIVKYLVENGADVNIKNNQGETALMTALILYIKIFKKENKLDAKIMINSILDKCLKIVKFLIKNKACVNIINNEGKTALDLAEENGCEEVAKFLRNAGARHGH